MLTLYDGRTYEPATDNSDSFRITEFEQQQIALQLKGDLERAQFQNQSPRTMSISQLKTFIGTLQNAQKTGQNPEYTLNQLRYAEVEYHKKFAIPFACLAFGLMGVPLGLMMKQNGRMIGLGLGLALILAYYLLLQVGQSTGSTGILPPLLAMWLPNLIIGILGMGVNLFIIAECKIRAWRQRDSRFVMNPLFKQSRESTSIQDGR